MRYFATLREQAGVQEETLQTSAATMAELYEELSEKHRFTLPASSVKAAVDLEFVPLDRPLTDNSEVVLIPPVAGG